jgi:hypothetical protein
MSLNLQMHGSDETSSISAAQDGYETAAASPAQPQGRWRLVGGTRVGGL